jgi:hypothetical protein
LYLLSRKQQWRSWVLLVKHFCSPVRDGCSRSRRVARPSVVCAIRYCR